MNWRALALGCAAWVGVLVAPIPANAQPQTYVYTITHPQYGAIGTYTRSVDEAEGITRAESHVKVTVKILGLVVHREVADQTEVWRGPQLMSFDSTTTVNGHRTRVSGEASRRQFLVTSPSGTVVAPADIVASDPWSLDRMGAGMVVSIKSGRIDPVVVTGGETETVTLRGAAAPARHFHVNTAAQPNKWEVWINQQGVPIKFRSLEKGVAIDFILVSSSPSALGPPGALASRRFR